MDLNSVMKALMKFVSHKNQHSYKVLLEVNITYRNRNLKLQLGLTCIIKQIMSFKLGLVSMGPKFKVRSLSHVNESQHDGKVPTFEPQVPIKVGFMSYLEYFMQKHCWDSCCKLDLAFFST